MNGKILLKMAFLFLFFFTSCQTISKTQLVLYDIEKASFMPNTIFEHNGTVFFAYNAHNEQFFLKAKIPNDPSDKIGRVEFKIEKGISFDYKNIVYLPDISGIWDETILDFAVENAPTIPMTGVILSVFTRDGVIFKDENSALKFIDLKFLPENIDIVGNIKHEEFVNGVYKKLKETLEREYPDISKFIINMHDIPRVPFMYLDVDKGQAVFLVLPNFYRVKKDIVPFGYSTKFLYSALVNSHIIPIVKAPFTTVHRLFNQAFVSLGTIVRSTIKDVKGDIPPVNENDEYMDIAAFNRFLDRRITDEVYKARVKILLDGEEFFSHFLVNASKAQKDILIRLYVFAVDPYTLGIADMLKMKSNEGIKVKVLLDELNTVINWARTPEVIEDKNYKMPSIKKYLRKNSKIKVRTHPNTWVNFAHTKAIVIDDDIAYTGGMNFAESYRYFWHDMMVSLEGPIVLKLKDNFKRAWHFAGAGGDFATALYSITKKEKEYLGSTDGMIDVRLLYTTPSASQIYDAQIAAIKRSKKRIYLQNPYFSDPQIVNELIKARARGVDVRVILPSKNNVVLMYKNNKIKANILIKNGIRVYMYKGMTHVKAGIFDNWASIGSANYDRYSLYINQEMNLGISDPGFVKELEERLFNEDFKNSEELTEPFSIAFTTYISNALNPMK